MRLPRSAESPLDEFLDAFWRKRREYDRGIDARVYWKEFAEYVGRDFDNALIDELMRREIDFWTDFDYTRLELDEGLAPRGPQNQYSFEPAAYAR